MGLWAFVLCISSPFRIGYCLGVGSLPFTWPMFPFVLRSWVGWCSCHATTLLLLWYHFSFYLLLPLGLRVEALVMSISYIIHSFRLYCPTFLLGQTIPCLGLPQPISFLRHPRLVSFFGHPKPASSAHFILWASSAHFIIPYLFHSKFLINPLGFPSPITTSLPFGLIGLCANPINLLIHFLGFPGPFLLYLHLLQFLWAYYFIPWAFSTHLLSFWPLVTLRACWPLFLPF